MTTSPYRLAARLEREGRLDGLAETLDRTIPPPLREEPLRSALAGIWLGHALHPMLTDVPLGTWMSATMLDVLLPRRGHTASAVLTGVGLAAAAPTIASGVVEWLDTPSRERRVAAAHAVINLSAGACYLVSFLGKLGGRRPLGTGASIAGGVLAMAGGYLGGHLSFGRAVGADQAHPRLRSEPDAIPVGSVEDEDGARSGRSPDSERFLVLPGTRGQRLAVPNRCTRCGSPIEMVGPETAVCRRDHSRFGIPDERVERGPATVPLPVFEVAEEVDGLRLIRR